MGVCNFGNTLALSVIFVWKCSEFNVGFKILEKNFKKTFVFIDKCIWIGCVKYSLLRTEYFS